MSVRRQRLTLLTRICRSLCCVIKLELLDKNRESNSFSLFFCVFFPFYFLERKNVIHGNISTICQLNCIESFTENSFCATTFSTERSCTWLRAIYFPQHSSLLYLTKQIMGAMYPYLHFTEWEYEECKRGRLIFRIPDCNMYTRLYYFSIFLKLCKYYTIYFGY